MAHVLEDHEQRAALSADTEEAHDVLVLQDGEQLRLPLEVLPCTLRHLLQRLHAGAAGLSARPAASLAHTHGARPRGPPPPEHPVLERGASGSPWTGSYLDGHERLVLLRQQAVALRQEDLPEGAFAQLPLEHDVLALDVTNTCREACRVRPEPVLGRGGSRPGPARRPACGVRLPAKGVAGD